MERVSTSPNKIDQLAFLIFTHQTDLNVWASSQVYLLFRVGLSLDFIAFTFGLDLLFAQI